MPYHPHITLIAAATITLLIGGCSSTNEMDQLRAEISANRDAAARAQASADAAARKADDVAHATREAYNAAQAANARLDRMAK